MLVRILQLALAALLCAVLSGLAALYGQLLALPPTDGAYGMSLAQLLRDPFVFDVWFLVVALAGGVGFLFALPLLWRVRLVRALPFVLIPTVLASLLAGAALGGLAPFFVLVVSIVMMIACHVQPKWALPAASDESARREARA